MDTLTTLALNKGIKAAAAKEASSMLEAGTHAIDTTIHVTGSVTKGEDYDQIQHMKVDQWAMIAVLASKVNAPTIESVVAEINKVDKATVTAIKAQAQAAMDNIKAPANTTTAGKVTTSLVFTEV
jgi:hypothetical protein